MANGDAVAKTKTLRVLTFARFQAVLMAPLGLVAGILYSFGGAIYELATSSLNSGTALAFLALLGMPVVFAGIGFVVGLIEALLFNTFAGRLGGIETGSVQ